MTLMFSTSYSSLSCRSFSIISSNVPWVVSPTTVIAILGVLICDSSWFESFPACRPPHYIAQPRRVCRFQDAFRNEHGGHFFWRLATVANIRQLAQVIHLPVIN